MSHDDHLAVLRDEQRSVVERLRAGAKLELVYWDQRVDEPNLSRDEFVRILPLIPQTQVKWSPRESPSGKYGTTGEEQVFSFEFTLNFGRTVYVYYLKGFFFEKNDLKCVEIQSFRIHRKYPKNGNRLRLV